MEEEKDWPYFCVVHKEVRSKMTTTRRRANLKGGKGEQKHNNVTSRNNSQQVSNSSSSGDNRSGDSGHERPFDSQSDQKSSQTKKGQDTTDKESNRNKFLFFMCNLIANEVEVELRDGRKFVGVFHTGVPLKGMNFDLVIRLARRSDGTYDVPKLSKISYILKSLSVPLSPFLPFVFYSKWCICSL